MDAHSRRTAQLLDSGQFFEKLGKVSVRKSCWEFMNGQSVIAACVIV